MSMTKIQSALIFASAMFFFALTAFAQVSVNPQHDFYTDAKIWHLKGYTGRLPQIRPYPLSVIRGILLDVMSNAEEYDAKKARTYYEALETGNFSIELEGAFTKKIERDIDEKKTSSENQLSIGPFAVGDVQVQDWMSFGYDIGVYANNVEDEKVMPLYVNSAFDTVDDPVGAGPLDANIDMNTSLALTKGDITFQAGINRSGFGPFLGDDVAMSDTAFHAPNFSVSYDGGRWTYTQIYAMIGSTLNNGNKPRKSESGKYFALHSFRYDVFPELAVSFYESTVFKDANFAYAAPAPFMAIQGMGGSTDNSQMGLLFEFHPISGFEWSTSVMADDIDINALGDGSIDAKNRIAVETGVRYAPRASFCDMLSIDYTLVTPYTYAHWSYDDDGKSFSDSTYNYFNYVNHGVNMGVSIPPNSDRVTFSATFRPIERLKAKFSASVVRHGNIYESLSSSERKKIYDTNKYSRENGVVYVNPNDGSPFNPANGAPPDSYIKVETDGGDVYSSDGGCFTQQKFVGSDVHIDTAWDTLNFLNQDNIMSVYRTGVDLEYALPRFSLGLWTIKFGYEVEYIHNDGVQRPMFSGRHGGDYESAYKAWKKQLHDTVNQYISAGIKIVY